MLFISFKKRGSGPGKRPKPGKITPLNDPIFRAFAGSAEAKTILKKEKEADKGLAALDKSGLHPENPEYQARLKQLYIQKYTNAILYWQRALAVAKKRGAGPETIKYIASSLSKTQNLWKESKKFLK